MNVHCRSLRFLPFVVLAARAVSAEAGVRVTDPAPMAASVPAVPLRSHLELAFGPGFATVSPDVGRPIWCGSATYEFADSSGLDWVVRGEFQGFVSRSREALGGHGGDFIPPPPSGSLLHRDELSFLGLGLGLRSNRARATGVDYLEATFGIGRWRTEASDDGPGSAGDRSETVEALQGTAALALGHRQPLGALPFGGLIEFGVMERWGRDAGVVFPMRAGVVLQRAGAQGRP